MTQTGTFDPNQHLMAGCECEGKKCSRCGEVKCHGSFGKEKRTILGLQAACKVCRRAAGRAYYHAHSERYSIYNEANKEQVQEYKRNWRARKGKEYEKTLRDARRERISEQRKKRYQISRETIIKRVKKYREIHPDYNREYAQANPEIILAKTRRRRARRKQATGSHTRQEWEALKSQYDYTCLRCGRKEPEIKLTPDHIIPLVKHGSHDIGNIQSLCFPCNSWKRTKIIDYRRSHHDTNSI